jgi:hypothetical protein
MLGGEILPIQMVNSSHSSIGVDQAFRQFGHGHLHLRSILEVLNAGKRRAKTEKAVFFESRDASDRLAL